MGFPRLNVSALKAASVALILVLASASAHAIVDDLDEEEVAAAVAGPVANNRYEYVGSRDEQALDVQASLPVPVRSQDGSVSIRLPSDADSESSHD